MSLAKEHQKARTQLAIARGCFWAAILTSLARESGWLTAIAVTAIAGVLLIALEERAMRTGIEASDEEHDLHREDVQALHGELEKLEHANQELCAENATIRLAARIPTTSTEEWT